MQIAGGEKIFHTQVIIIGVYSLILNILRQLDLFFILLHIKLTQYFSNRIEGKVKFVKDLSTQCSYPHA